MNLVNLLLISIFSENIVLTKFLGLCPFTTSKEKNPLVIGLMILAVIIPVSIISYFLYHSVLVSYDMTYFTTVFTLILILIFVKLLELFLRLFLKKKYEDYKNYLPFVVINSSVLGIVLWNISKDYPFLDMLIYVIGSSIGLIFVLYIFSGVQNQMKRNPVPSFLKGAPILLFTGALVALLFERFIGL